MSSGASTFYYDCSGAVDTDVQAAEACEAYTGGSCTIPPLLTFCGAQGDPDVCVGYWEQGYCGSYNGTWYCWIYETAPGSFGAAGPSGIVTAGESPQCSAVGTY